MFFGVIPIHSPMLLTDPALSKLADHPKFIDQHTIEVNDTIFSPIGQECPFLQVSEIFLS